MKESMSTPAVLSVRVSPTEREMLQVAAQRSRSTVSEFMRRKALEAAESELIERRIVTLSADDWSHFEARLAEPAKPIPAVQELFRRPSVCTE